MGSYPIAFFGSQGLGKPDNLDLQAGKVSAPEISPHRFIHKILSNLEKSSDKSTLKLQFTETLKSIAEEKNWDRFYEGLLELGEDLQGSTQIPEAALVYEILTNPLNHIPKPKALIQKKAREALEVLRGGGKLGQQLEFQSGHFLKDLSNPIHLLPMAAAGLTFAPVRLGVFKLLGGGGASAGLLRSLSVHGLAFGMGLGAESAVFVGAGRGIQSLMGHQLDWSRAALEREFYGTAILLGSLKLSGGASRMALKHPQLALTPGAGLGKKFAHWMIPQGAMYASILGTHWLETGFGWRDPQSGAHQAAGALITLLHFNALGRLMEFSLGPRYQEINKDIEQRAGQFGELLYQKVLKIDTPPPPPLAWAGAGFPKGAHGSKARLFNPIIQMSGQENGGPKKPYTQVVWPPSSKSPEAKTPEKISSEQITQEKIPPDSISAEFVSAEFISAESIPPKSPPPESKPADSLVGQTIGGNFEVKGVLGEGGMGRVYWGEHPVINKKVAIKVLLPKYFNNKEVKARFIREAQAMAAINNKHIIDITDFGELKNGAPYFIMEYLRGKNLANVIDEGDPIPLESTIKIADQIANGMAAAHKEGIVHRDLKPENIFLTPEGRPEDFIKILDFGLAKLQTLSRMTQVGNIMGSPAYFSPEQAHGNPVDHRADIYSLGVILYELSTGRVPFGGEHDTVNSVMIKQMYTPPEPVRKTVKNPHEFPVELETLIMKCLEKDPKDRYQSMDELKEALKPIYYSLRPDSTPPASHISSTPPASRISSISPSFQKPGPNWKILGGLGGILAAGGIGAILWRSFSSSETIPAPSSTAPDLNPSSTPPVTPPTSDLDREVPSTKKVYLAVEPMDAVILQDGKDLGESPIILKIKEGETAKIKISKKGYKSQTIEIDGSKEKISVKLKKITRSPGSGKPVAPPPPPSHRPPPPNPKGKGEDNGTINPWIKK